MKIGSLINYFHIKWQCVLTASITGFHKNTESFKTIFGAINVNKYLT